VTPEFVADVQVTNGIYGDVWWVDLQIGPHRLRQQNVGFKTHEDAAELAEWLRSRLAPKENA